MAIPSEPDDSILDQWPELELEIPKLVGAHGEDYKFP